MIKTVSEIYDVAQAAIQICREQGYDDVAQELDDAMHLGSSRLEILGAIKAAFISHEETLQKVLDQATMQEVVKYVNEAFGADA